MHTATSYLGLRLPHPFIAGASPLGYRLDSIKRLEDAGCAAVVLHSLFEEQITYITEGRVAHADVFGGDFSDLVREFPAPDAYPQTPDEYADHVYRAKQAVSVPVIASINGCTEESWLMYARILEQAGADALEVNTYQIVADLTTPGAAVEARIIGTVKDLTRILKIPIAVKLSPYFAALGSVARQLDTAGADGLVLFNRFYQPDIDVTTMTLRPTVDLSTSAELRLRLRWLAIPHGRVRPSLAASGGIAEPRDAIKAILAGADVVQLVSALLRHGPAHVATMRRELERWLDWNQTTVDAVRGRLSEQTTSDVTTIERARYIQTLHSWVG
jgi:dihydroorotate dehydrogenase (fumarate)